MNKLLCKEKKHSGMSNALIDTRSHKHSSPLDDPNRSSLFLPRDAFPKGNLRQQEVIERRQTGAVPYGSSVSIDRHPTVHLWHFDEYRVTHSAIVSSNGADTPLLAIADWFGNLMFRRIEYKYGTETIFDIKNMGKTSIARDMLYDDPFDAVIINQEKLQNQPVPVRIGLAQTGFTTKLDMSKYCWWSYEDGIYAIKAYASTKTMFITLTTEELSNLMDFQGGGNPAGTITGNITQVELVTYGWTITEAMKTRLIAQWYTVMPDPAFTQVPGRVAPMLDWDANVPITIPAGTTNFSLTLTNFTHPILHFALMFRLLTDIQTAFKHRPVNLQVHPDTVEMLLGSQHIFYRRNWDEMIKENRYGFKGVPGFDIGVITFGEDARGEQTRSMGHFNAYDNNHPTLNLVWNVATAATIQCDMLALRYQYYRFFFEASGNDKSGTIMRIDPMGQAQLRLL